ncbi:MAG: nitrite/sulfite reductase [Alphaproteobacteria bacterium]
MYRYDEFDRALVLERVEQFRGQVARRLSGELEEEEFKALRLRNGLYLQLHAYMLRVAIPYGTLSSQQMRKLAHIARVYDRDYGHFTTRQNIQYNWPKLVDVPDILAELAEVEMHAIQTSGNCIRNVTADHFAGVAADEIEDPRVYAEIVRQWSTLHPEFSFLPRKFKIAVNGTAQDRAALRVHDIGLQIRRNSAGKIGFEVMVGGGQGRTPYIAPTIRGFLPKQHLLSYLEAILRVYNQLGRRDNLYKARIKILVDSTGVENFTNLVEEEWAEIKGGELTLPEDEHRRILDYFSPPQYQDSNGASKTFETHKTWNLDFSRWCKTNVVNHKRPGFSIITISLKPIGSAPGDASADQMDVIAGLAEKFSHDEIRVTHEQNLVLAHVCQSDIYEVWEALENAALSTPNIGLISDMITCPGLDYCNLANARSIPVAQNIAKKFEDLDRQHDIGELKIKISGCINACGHHHVGHIGILGVDKRGEEFYQITLGGSGAEDAALGDIVGRAFGYDEVTGAIETIVDTYVTERRNGERFLDTYRRVGLGPFKEALYGTA